MKRNNPYLLAAALLAVAFTGCKNDEYDNKSPFDNVVYLNVSENSDTQVTTFKKTLPDLPKTFSVVLSYPASQAVSVGVEVDPSLVETYNARHNTSWTMLDAKYYELSVTELTIPAGKTISDAVTLKLKNLDGSGEVEELPIDQTYLLPVTIADVGGGVAKLHSSATAYYLVKRSSAITSAASLRDNWINFPTLDKASEGSMLFNNLTAVTYEAIIRVDDFSKHSEISTIMGVENYLLLRIGDASFPRQQIQFDGSGDAAQTPGFGKFPKKDETKLLNPGEWYHIAATYSYATREVCIYVNGKLQSRGTDLGNSASTPFNLAGRAFYDLYLQDSETYKDYKDWGNFRQFFLGKSYDDSRQLNGDITEVRVRPRASGNSPRRTRRNCSIPGSGTTLPPLTAMLRARSASTSTASSRAEAPISEIRPRHRSTLRGAPSTISTCKTRKRIRTTRTGVISASSSSASLMTTRASSTAILPKCVSGR